jgi:hypothetical protein
MIVEVEVTNRKSYLTRQFSAKEAAEMYVSEDKTSLMNFSFDFDNQVKYLVEDFMNGKTRISFLHVYKPVFIEIQKELF